MTRAMVRKAKITIDIARPDKMGEREWLARLDRFVEAYLHLNGLDATTAEIHSTPDLVERLRYPHTYRSSTPYHVWVVADGLDSGASWTAEREERLDRVGIGRDDDALGRKYLVGGGLLIAFGGLVRMLSMEALWDAAMLVLLAAVVVALGRRS